MAEVVRTGISVRDQEVTIERPDGSRGVALVNIEALRDPEGTIIGAVNCFQDITERKQAEEQIRVLAREVDHRAKNLLSLVQATVHLTKAETAEDFKAATAREIPSGPKGESSCVTSVRMSAPVQRDSANSVCAFESALMRPSIAALNDSALKRARRATIGVPKGSRARFRSRPDIWRVQCILTASRSWLERSRSRSRPGGAPAPSLAETLFPRCLRLEHLGPIRAVMAHGQRRVLVDMLPHTSVLDEPAARSNIARRGKGGAIGEESDRDDS
jgi:hypothetical protein